MLQSRVFEQDQRLAEERRSKYIGVARVRLEILHFPGDEPRVLDRKNVERLKGCFRSEKCRRLEQDNHIPAVIDESQLIDTLRLSGTSASGLLSQPISKIPELKFPTGYQLTCLHGRHRIQAGREVLPRRDAWWAVDLYSAGMYMKNSETEF